MAKIIVVDDDLIALELVTRLLEKSGDRVWRMANAEDVIAALDGPDCFDLVILDIILPAMSGIELAERIRAKFPSLPMIAMSAYITRDSTATVENLRQLGITEIVSKPIGALNLLPAVNRTLRAHG
jgi:two-component system nitrogen regulation response regulator GlnG